MAPDPSVAELVHVRLPARVDEAPLEPLVGDRLADDPDHEPVALQRPVNGPPADLNSSAAEDRVDPHRAPEGVAPSERKDPIDEVSVNPVRAVMGAAGLVS